MKHPHKKFTTTARVLPMPVAGHGQRRANVELHRRQPGAHELERINEIIAAAIACWDLPERVKRISLPLYRYLEYDLPHMRFVIATTNDAGIVGVASVEQATAGKAPAIDAGLLHGIYVDPRYQRKGVGRRLLAAAERLAIDGGASGLLVRAQADAVAFFVTNGYRELPIADHARDYTHRCWKPLSPDAAGSGAA